MGATTTFNEKSFRAIGITLVSVLTVGFLCKAAGLPTEVTGAATSVALMVPSALAQRGQKRQADQVSGSDPDPGRPAAGVARQSVSPLHAVILGGALVLLDSVLGIVVRALESELGGLVVFVLELLIIFLAMSRLVEWLGPKPYPTVAVAVGVTFAVRLFLIMLVPNAVEEVGMDGAGEVFVLVLITHLLMLAAALAGLWRARRRVDRGEPNTLVRTAASAVPTPMSSIEPTAPYAPAAAARPEPAAASVPPVPPAGWYPDPDLRGIERWWDGSAWTDNRRNKPQG